MHGKQPDVASLRNSSNLNHLCGAALISSRFALTAAHCVTSKANEYVLKLNNVCIRHHGITPTVTVSEIIINDSYDPVTRAHDIAVLRFPVLDDITWLKHTLPRSSFGLSGECEVYGYGYRDVGTKETSEILLAGTLRIISLDKCENRLGPYVAPKYEHGMMCAAGDGVDACQQLDLVSPFQLYFNPNLILTKYQLWRLITTFLFFGNLGFNFFFNMIFTYRYCRMLEEGSFRGRTADFVVMFVFGGVLMIICAFFVNLLFLGQAFTIMIVYVWSRRNVFVRMNFFGLMNFQAPYLPWVLLGFSVLLGNAISVDLVGMAIGHIYFFMEDVLPRERGGQKVLKTPKFLIKLLDGLPEEPEYVPLPELNNLRPGGFDWGRRNVDENAPDR